MSERDYQEVIRHSAQDFGPLQAEVYAESLGSIDALREKGPTAIGVKHAGNLSFVNDQGRPYALGPAYDMLPMAFSPTAGGVVSDTAPVAHLHPSVDGETWRAAGVLAGEYLTRLSDDTRFSDAFQPCIDALRGHLDEALQKIGRLG